MALLIRHLPETDTVIRVPVRPAVEALCANLLPDANLTRNVTMRPLRPGATSNDDAGPPPTVLSEAQILRLTRLYRGETRNEREHIDDLVKSLAAVKATSAPKE